VAGASMPELSTHNMAQLYWAAGHFSKIGLERWMDGLKVGEIKFPTAGHKSVLMCITQMKK
jgi:hypothetical protein